MADQVISLRWAGRGTIQSDNITPVTLKKDKKRSYKKTTPKNANLIIEGDNAPVMKSLCAGTLRMRGKVDFMLWDPPYNTGNKDFLYEDNFYLTRKAQQEWTKTRSKKQVLEITTGKKGLKAKPAERLELWVKETDASRHSKWLSFMEVRLELAKKLLKETGVIAVHISYHELFRLGLLMDEVFGEDNRLGIVNWECTYGPKNSNRGIPSTTDYILIYAKNKALAYRGILPRTKSMNDRYKNPDNDPRGPWIADNLTVGMNASMRPNQAYDLVNPKTGKIYKFNSNRVWTFIPSTMAKMIREGRIIFPEDTKKRPMLKRYLYELKHEGRSIGTYWQSEELVDTNEPISIALSHKLSENNGDAKRLLRAILGDKCVFDTPKPLKLTERLIEMFCPKDGMVFDAFGGSATTAHAVLSLNAKAEDSDRKFILIERGTDHHGFTDTITAERVRRVIDGKWAQPHKDVQATGGSFVYLKAGKPISGKYILESKRDDLIDIILTSHEGSTAFDTDTDKSAKYMIGYDASGRGIALVWDPTKGDASGHLTMKIHKDILDEAKKLNLKKPILIYGSVNAGPNGSASYEFRQIPDEILAALEITNLKD